MKKHNKINKVRLVLFAVLFVLVASILLIKFNVINIGNNAQQVDTMLKYGLIGILLAIAINLLHKQIGKIFLELQKTTWPSRKEWTKTFFFAIIWILIIVAISLGADLVFYNLRNQMLLK